MSHHFLGHLRHTLYAAVHCPVTLWPDQHANLLLWKDFLQQAHSGISLNLLTFCLPTHIGHSNRCEHGIGGFSVTPSNLLATKMKLPTLCLVTIISLMLPYLLFSLFLFLNRFQKTSIPVQFHQPLIRKLWLGISACHPQCSHWWHHIKASSLLEVLKQLPQVHQTWWWSIPLWLHQKWDAPFHYRLWRQCLSQLHPRQAFIKKYSTSIFNNLCHLWCCDSGLPG